MGLFCKYHDFCGCIVISRPYDHLFTLGQIIQSYNISCKIWENVTVLCQNVLCAV